MTDDFKVRVISYQFRRNGLVHKTTVRDSVHDGTLHVSHPHTTFCGKNIPIGTGGWGYGKLCPQCYAQELAVEEMANRYAEPGARWLSGDTLHGQQIGNALHDAFVDGATFQRKLQEESAQQ